VATWVIDQAIYLTSPQKTMQNLQNRPLDPRHVDGLVANFTTIRRHLPHDQLCISMTPEDLEACIEFTVSHMKGRPRNKSTKDVYKDVDTLRAAVTTINRLYTQFTDMPVLCWPPQRRPCPQLDAGQSRRSAMVKKHNLDAGDEELSVIEDDNMKVRALASLVPFRGPLIERSI
jgi:hypothetical protein